MADAELPLKVEQVRVECTGLEERLEQRDRHETDALAALNAELALLATTEERLVHDIGAAQDQLAKLRAEQQRLRPGLGGWRLYRARVFEPALYILLLLACIFTWAWAGRASHQVRGAGAGLTAGVVLALLLLGMRSWRGRDGR